MITTDETINHYNFLIFTLQRIFNKVSLNNMLVQI